MALSMLNLNFLVLIILKQPVYRVLVIYSSWYLSYPCINVLLLLTELSSPVIYDSLKCLLGTLEPSSAVTLTSER